MTNPLRGGKCFDVCCKVPFFTQWLFYKSINLHLHNWILLCYITPSYSFLKKQQTRNIFLKATTVPASNILWKLFFWRKIHKRVLLLSNTVALIVFCNGIKIVIIVKSRGCFKLVCTTAHFVWTSAQCYFWCNFPVFQMTIKTENDSECRVQFIQ